MSAEAPKPPAGSTTLVFDSGPADPHTLTRHRPGWQPDEAIRIDLSDPRQRQFGDYELIERLGQGGMGVVYRARQRSLDRDVALKLMVAGPSSSPGFIERFRQEARSAARMQHPNIVEIYEIGERDGLHYFSMRLVGGESLGERIRRSGPLAPRDAALLLRTLAEATDYAHRLGFLHLDLKPANVLIAGDGQPLIADFGLARPLDALHAEGTGEVSGTPSYMAPEQVLAQAQPLSPATDIYGLGGILYEVLCGRPAFRGGGIEVTLEQVVHAEPVPPRKRRRDIPPDLEAICLCCLAKDPARRYSSARKLAEDLGRFLDEGTVSVRDPGPWEKSLRWCRRHPARLLMWISLLVGLGTTLQQWRRAESALAEVQQRQLRQTQTMALMGSVFEGGTEDQGRLEDQATAVVQWLDTHLAEDEAAQAELLEHLVETLISSGNEYAADALFGAIVNVLGNEERQRRVEELARRQDADSLLAAALLSGGDPRIDGDEAQRQRIELLQRALAADPRHVLALHIASQMCTSPYEACPAEDAPRRLLALDADNALHWAAAAPRDDPAGLRAHLAGAARTRRFDDHYGDLLRLLQRVLGQGDSALPETMRRPARRLLSERQMGELALTNAAIAIPVPPVARFANLCQPVEGGAMEAGLRADCLAYGRLAADAQGSVVAQNVGINLLRRIARGTPLEQEMLERRRRYLWVAQMQPPWGRRNPRADQLAIFELIASQGELHAFQQRLQAFGIAAEPPAGWQPENPADLLLPEDRERQRERERGK